MKNKILFSILIILFIVAATSCKKSCNCYNVIHEVKVDFEETPTTKKQCQAFQTFMEGMVDCKWE